MRKRPVRRFRVRNKIPVADNLSQDRLAVQKATGVKFESDPDVSLRRIIAADGRVSQDLDRNPALTLYLAANYK